MPKALARRQRIAIVVLLIASWLLAPRPSLADRPLPSHRDAPPSTQAPETAPVAKADASADIEPGQVVVVMRQGVSAQSHETLLTAHGLRLLQHEARLNAHVVAVPEGRELALAETISQDPNVAYAEPVYRYHASLVPEDPHYAPYQWHLPHIGLPQAWEISTGSSAVIVAVLDTGLDLGHPDAPLHLASGYDYINNDADPSDDNGHGTHVAGTIAARTNNAIGVAGVAWNTTILPIKVLNQNGLGLSTQIANGIYRAVEAGADIINLSLGGPWNDQTTANAIDFAYNQGVAIVAAAGNEYQDLNAPSYPAALPNVLAVAATGNLDEHAAYSTTGFYIDIAAPGGNPISGYDPDPAHWIMSTYRTSSGFSYAQLAGTSMATPHVAGVLAVLKAQNPALTVDQLYERVCSTAVDLGAPGWDEVFGWGRLNAYAALSEGTAIGGPAADGYEDDNTSSQASNIALGERQTEHTIAPLGDQDWARLTLAVGGQIIVETFDPTDAGIDTVLTLYAQQGTLLNQIAQDDDSGEGLCSRLVAFGEAGTYYIKVEEQGNDDLIASYELAVSAASVDPWISAYGPDSGGWSDMDNFPRQVADVNGDGLADIVGFGNMATYVSLSNGNSFGAPIAWIASYGVAAGGWFSQNIYPRQLADVNGDGLADIVGFSKRATYVSLSNGSSFLGPKAWIANYGVAAGGWTSQDLFPRQVADVNGDGLADIVGFGNKATYVSLSSGSSFDAPEVWIADYGVAAGGWFSQDLYPRLLGDVNGDGLADIVGFGNKATYVSLSTGSSFAPAKTWIASYGVSAGGWTTQDARPRQVGDVNRDGLADIVGFGALGTVVSFSSGASFGPSLPWVANYGADAGGWASQNITPRLLGNVGGSGADVIGLSSRDVYVTLAD